MVTGTPRRNPRCALQALAVQKASQSKQHRARLFAAIDYRVEGGDYSLERSGGSSLSPQSSDRNMVGG